jgi:hypothetical protein
MPGAGAKFARQNFLRGLDPELVTAELEARGATVVHSEVRGGGAGRGAEQSETNQPATPEGDGRRICRMVVQWQA